MKILEKKFDLKNCRISDCESYSELVGNTWIDGTDWPDGFDESRVEDVRKDLKRFGISEEEFIKDLEDMEADFLKCSKECMDDDMVEKELEDLEDYFFKHCSETEID